jgi:site-specific DNA-methyltransferase (adenine-specific)
VTIDLRCGPWQKALADVEQVDAVICDPPYSERTHSGHEELLPGGRRGLRYRPWNIGTARSFAIRWGKRCRGWVCILTDHVLALAFADGLEDLGRYVFAPLPLVIRGSRVRLAGDGPSSWTVWLVVARPRTLEYARWGTLPGAYVGPPERAMTVAGGKTLWLMRALVRDYSRPGDLVCDPCAGGATTLLAAAIEGRRAIGAERDPETYRLAQERLAAGWTPALLPSGPEPRAEQLDWTEEP